MIIKNVLGGYKMIDTNKTENMNVEYSKLEKAYKDKFGVEPPPSYMLGKFLPKCYKRLSRTAYLLKLPPMITIQVSCSRGLKYPMSLN
jgi:hypothetical protein